MTRGWGLNCEVDKTLFTFWKTLVAKNSPLLNFLSNIFPLKAVIIKFVYYLPYLGQNVYKTSLVLNKGRINVFFLFS